MHDKVYEKGPKWYRGWTDKQYSEAIHKAAFFAFIFSYVIFYSLQYLMPLLMNPLNPNQAMAGSNTKTWTTRGDFLSAVTANQVNISGNLDSDDSSVTLGTNPAAITPDYGTGADGEATLNSGTITIKDIYENDAVVGVTTVRGADKGLNKGVGTYNPDTNALPNFTNLTINGGAILTTTGPSGANPGQMLKVRISGTLTIASGGRISADAKGYGSYQEIGYGPGGGTHIYNRTGGGGGGGYGGNGSVGSDPVNLAGTAYDFQTSPFGSGAGEGYNPSAANGGGAIFINCSALVNNGSITSNGGSPGGISPSQAGGGSGGSVYIIADGTSGSGTLSANGGNAPWSGLGYGGGGGGGGRIFIQTPAMLTGTVNGGSGGASGTELKGAANTDGVVKINSYLNPGSLGGTVASDVGLKFDAGTGVAVRPSSLTWNGVTNLSGQKILFKVRAGNTQAELDANQCYGPTTLDSGCADWTTAGKFFSQINGQPNSAITIPTAIGSKRYVEVLVRLESSLAGSPTLNDVALSYNSLDTPITLKAYKSDNTDISTTANYTNETSANLKADLGMPNANGSPITPQFEVRTADSGWTGTPNTNSVANAFGVTPNATDVTYTCGADPCSALGSQSIGSISGLSAGTPYYWRVRTTDAAGRVSAWSATSTVINVDQTAPTISSVSINAGASYVNSTTVNVTVNTSDTGGSNLSKLYLSNNGTDWTDVTPASNFVGQASYNSAVSWTLASGDGTKQVFAKVLDLAGNTAGQFIQNTTADFASGVRGSNIGAGTNNITLLKAIGVAATSGSECITGYVSGGVCATPWIQGVSPLSSSLYVYASDLPNASWGPKENCDLTNYTGLNPDCNSGFLKTGASTNFTSYPAQKSCLNVGGRLPTDSELSAMYTSRATYGTFPQNRYWSSRRANDTNAVIVFFSLSGTVDSYDKTGSLGVRCVADSLPDGLGGTGPAGTFVSSAKDLGSSMNLSSINWNTNVTNGVKFQIASNDDNATWNFVGPNNDANAYYTTASGTNITSEHNGHRYVKYKAFLTAQSGNYPTLSSVSIFPVTPSQTVTLDQQAPTGSIAINPGNPTYSVRAVNLLINPTDPEPGGSGIKEFQLSNDGVTWGTATDASGNITDSGTWKTWSETYRTAYAWNLVGTDGQKTVYVKFKDNAGNLNSQNNPDLVMVGNQNWMKKNLNVGTTINTGVAQSDNGVIEKYCYGNNESNCTTYGGLYKWNEAMQYTSSDGAQGICPTNFHIPTNTEMDTLLTFLGGSTVAGGKLKEIGTTHWTTPNTGATNEFGYTLLPGGWSDNTSSGTSGIGSNAYLWTSTQPAPGSYAYRFNVLNNTAAANKSQTDKGYGFSIRCLANNGYYDSSISDTVTLDTTAPSGSLDALNANYNTQNINLGYASSDAGSGVADAKLFYTTNTSLPYTWTQYGSTYTSTPISFTAAASNNYGFKLVLADNLGNTNISGTPGTSVTPDRTTLVDILAPTASVSINEGDRTASTDVHLTITAADTGGSNLSTYELSNDGNNWSTPVSISGTFYSNNNVSWTLASGDGLKIVYLRVKDAAGTYSNQIADVTSASFQNGTLDKVEINGGIRLSGTTATIDVVPTEDTYGDAWLNTTFYGDSTTLKNGGKTNSGYGMPLPAFYKFNFAGSIPVGYSVVGAKLKIYDYQSDACAVNKTMAVGLMRSDITWTENKTNHEYYNYNSSAPTTNRWTDLGGTYPQWPSLGYSQTSSYTIPSSGQWIEANVTDLVNYGHNSLSDSFGLYSSPAAGYYSGMPDWTNCTYNSYSSEYSDQSLRPKLSITYAQAGPPYTSVGTYTSDIKDLGANSNLTDFKWSEYVPTNTAITTLVRVGNNADLSDGTWEAITNGASLAGYNGKRYFQYKFTLATTDVNVSPQVLGVFIGRNNVSDYTSADATPPTDVSGLKAYTDSGKGTEFTNNTWHTNTSVYFEWNEAIDDGVGLGGYKYCLSNLATCTPTTDLSTTRNYTATFSSPPDEKKYFRVVAYDLVNNTSTNVATFTYGFDRTAPTAVTDVSASTSIDSYVHVAWNAVNDSAAPISYVVERIKNTVWENGAYQLEDVDGKVWSSAAGYGKKTVTGTPPNNYYNDSLSIAPDTGVVLEAGIKYVYRVHVIDAAGNEGEYQALPVFGLTRDSGAPTTPTGVTALACSYQNPEYCSTTDDALKGHEIKLSWLPATDIGTGVDKYLIYRANSYSTVESNYTVVGVLDVPIPLPEGYSLAWNDNNANNDATFDTYKTSATPHLNDYTIYYYRIRAIDASDPANKSEFVPTDVTANAAMARTPDVTAPTAPGSVSAAALGLDGTVENTQKVQITWAASSDGTGSGVAAYKIFKATSATGTYTEVTNDPNVTCNFTDRNCVEKGLPEFTTYYYKLKAVDAAPYLNESSLSAYAMVRTASSAVPTAPLGPLNSGTGLKYDQPRVITKTGDPSTDAEVGHKNTITFSGSYAKNCEAGLRCIVGYEIYRSTTNYADNDGWKASATKMVAFSVSPIKEDRDTIYTFVDNDTNNDSTTPSITATVGQNSTTITGLKAGTSKLDDSATYYYKVRVIDNTPIDPDGGPFENYSTIAVGNLHAGWDTTADATAPALPADLKVKDIHDDGLNYKRNIITWARITTPTRNSENDFKEYRIYRSNDGLTWQQICQNGTDTILLDACNTDHPNPLYNADKELALANNYFMDLIPIADANQYYYYYVTAADDAADNFKYSDDTIINAFSNESAPNTGSNGAITSVSLNPAIAKPSICDVGSNPCSSTEGVRKASLVEVGVASATISWTTDQATDSIVEFKRQGTSDAFIGTINREMGTSHQVTIKPLLPNTTYEYRVISRNSLANDVIAEGSEVPALTTTGFNITAGSVVTTTSTAEINWTTNLDADSAFVEYQLQRQPGDEAQSGVAGASAESLASTPRSHKVIIKGLRSNRTYTYKIKSISKDGYLSEYPAADFANFKTKSFDSEQFTLAPSSSNVAERNITSTTAQIIWQTGTPTTSWVDYGTKSGVYDISAGDNNLTTSHVVVLTGLVPGTKYYYRVRVKDSNEVEFTSQEYTFTAVLKPKISSLTISNVTPYSVTISWDTNVETETLMNWGRTTAYGEKRGNATVSTHHSVLIENLEDNTEYHYQILAHDQAGNEVADDDRNVRTPLDTAGPKISDVKSDILLNEADNTAQVIISWKTDKPATTLVQYDEGVLGGKYSKSTVEDTGLANTHTVIIKDLIPAETYHFRIVTRDKRGNETISNDYNFITPTAEKSILQLILKSLEETFSWIGNLGKFFSNLGKKVN